MAKKKTTQNTNNSNSKRNSDDPVKSLKKNGNNGTADKPATKQSSKSGGGSTSYLLLIGVTVVVATTAVIYMNEDVQMFLVQLTPAGSNPFGVHSPSQSESTVNIQTSKENANTADKNNEKSNEANLKHQKETPDWNKDALKSEETASVKSDNSKEPGVKTDDSSETKTKSKREDYEKIAITSKGDYKIRKKLDAADKYLEQGDATKALSKYDNILKNNSYSPRALWGKAQATDKLAEQQRSNKLLEEAINLMDKALKLSKTPEPLLLQIAEKLADRQSFRGWSQKEAGTWKYLVDKYPDNLQFQRKLGVSYLKMGKNDVAKDLFKKILDVNKDDGFAQVHLGFILKINDLNYKEAIPMLQAGVDSGQAGTSDGRFFYHLGDAYMRENNTDKARQVYEKATDLGIFLSADQRSLYNAETKLTGRPWWTLEQTTYQTHLKLLEDNWKTIRDEGLAQLDLKTGAFLPEEENLRETGDWKQLTLYQRGRKNEENCKKAPKTCALIDQIPDAKGCTRGQVKYSVMHPGVHVWPHTGPTNCRIRAHLGLKVPEGPRIRVGNDIRTWKEGKFIVFDDSFEHEVWHEGTELRLVLIVDFWHPELPAHEKRSLSPI